MGSHIRPFNPLLLLALRHDIAFSQLAPVMAAGRPLGKHGLSPPATPKEQPPHRLSTLSPADLEALSLDGFKAFMPIKVPSLDGLLELTDPPSGGNPDPAAGAGMRGDSCQPPGPRRARSMASRRRPFSAPSGLKLPTRQRPSSATSEVGMLPASTMLCGVSSLPASATSSFPGASQCAGALGRKRPGRPCTGLARASLPHSALARSSSTGAIEKHSNAMDGTSVSEKRMTQGTHLHGSRVSEASMSISWLTQETTALDQLRAMSDAPGEALLSESALRSLLEISDSTGLLELQGSGINTSGSGTKVAMSPTLPFTDSPSLAPSGPPDSFILGVPMGLETSPKTAASKQLREVSAVLPHVAGLDCTTHTMLSACPSTEELPVDANATPAVSASTLAGQLWAPSSGDSKWKRLPSHDMPVLHGASSWATLEISKTMEKPRASSTEQDGTQEESVLLAPAPITKITMGPAASRGMPAGKHDFKASEQWLRRPRSVLSASNINHALPQRRLSVPSMLKSRHPHKPGVLKRVVPALKSVEEVLDERSRDALARFKTSPVSTPHSADERSSAG